MSVSSTTGMSWLLEPQLSVARPAEEARPAEARLASPPPPPPSATGSGARRPYWSSVLSLSLTNLSSPSCTNLATRFTIAMKRSLSAFSVNVGLNLATSALSCMRSSSWTASTTSFSCGAMSRGCVSVCSSCEAALRLRCRGRARVDSKFEHRNETACHRPAMCLRGDGHRRTTKVVTKYYYCTTTTVTCTLYSRRNRWRRPASTRASRGQHAQGRQNKIDRCARAIA